MESKKPNIFNAAYYDDVDELRLAIADGQTLDMIYGPLNRTPLHIGCIAVSTQFLNAAIELDFDPDLRDGNGNKAIDYAFHFGLTEIHRKIVNIMYPRSSKFPIEERHIPLKNSDPKPEF